MWQRNKKGLKYQGHYVRDQKGERVLVLIAVKTNGETHTITAESWQMLKAAGWAKVE